MIFGGVLCSFIEKEQNKNVADASRQRHFTFWHSRNDLTCFGHWHSIDVHQQPGTEQHHVRVFHLWHDDLTRHMLVAAPSVGHAEPGGESPEYRHADAVPGGLHPRVAQPHHLTHTHSMTASQARYMTSILYSDNTTLWSITISQYWFFCAINTEQITDCKTIWWNVTT